MADIKANATCRNSINPNKEAEAQQRKRMVEYQEEREEVIGDMMSRHPSILEDIPAHWRGLYMPTTNMENSFPADKPVAGQMSCPPQMHDSPPMTPPPRNLLHWAIQDGSPSAEDIQADGKGGPAGGQDGSPVAKVARRSIGLNALVARWQQKHEDLKAGATERAVGNASGATKVVKDIGNGAKKVIKGSGKWRGKGRSKGGNPKIDSSKKFDKAWFISGCPKQYGKVTVYLCRKNGLHRIKPMPGSRKLENLTWGRTDNERLSQWKKVMGKVNEYNR